MIAAFAAAPVTMTASPSEPSTSPPPKYTLHSIPVSFFAARVRALIYREPSLSSSVEIVSPPDNSMKSPAHLAINPLGKVPSLSTTSSPPFYLFESTAIASFLLAEHNLTHAYTYPSPRPAARVAMLSAYIDNHLAPLQTALYRAMPAETRAENVKALVAQLDILEGLIDAKPYLVGDKLTLADFNLVGVFALYNWAGPRFFGFNADDEASRPKLKSWYEVMMLDEGTKRAVGEVQDALETWRKGGRWEKLGVVEL